jgi:hypothetical protein
VFGAGRVAGGGANAAVLLPDEVLGVQALVRRVAPELLADLLVHQLGERLGQPVGESLIMMAL